MRFTHLHTHSHYSLLDGLAKIDELLDYCQELGMDSLALTDHGNMYGAVEFFQKAKKRNIKPLIGCEVYVAANSRFQKRPNIDNKPHHLVLLAKNETGYQNLVKIVTDAHLKGYYYKPRTDKDFLKEHHEGLIALSACLAGELPRFIKRGKMEEAEKALLEYREIFGSDFYLELQHHLHIPEQKIANDGLIALAKKYDLPLIATNDIHYARKDDAEAQDILMSVQMDKKVDDESRMTMKNEDFSMKSPKQMIDDFAATPEAITNTQKIVADCGFEFSLGQIKLPSYEVPDGKTADEYLKELCQEGLKKRLFETPMEKVLERLDYELEVIHKTGYAPYFLIVQDFVNWAKAEGIVVGPGRGSAAGSLASYLTNITDVDPLKYNLLFERFLNPERISMPDIDLDFADARRDEVIGYVKEKYGEDRVAQIITFGTMAARAAIRDVGRALGMPYSFCDQLAKLIPFNTKLGKALEEVNELKTAYNSDENAKRLLDMAKKLEGVARHASTHACGVVITKEPLDNIVPRQHPTQNDDSIVSQYEMHAIEDLGLLKMDFLGLKTLTVMQNTLNQIRELNNQEIDLSSVPLNDQATFAVFQSGNSTGVFQMESSGFKRYLKELKPTNIEDLTAMVALYRPGPMELIPDFIARKHGQTAIIYSDSKLEPVLKDTYGICIYQEQLMKIARELAGFSLAEADVLRKAVGKKIKKLLDEQKEKMVGGMVNNGIKKEIAEKIWHTIEPFAQYGFNRSHATCYALIAYRTAYLKAHFPTEFMASLMTSEQQDIERISFLIDECKKMKLQVLPPNINESEHDFTKAGGNIIRFGLKAVKNVGHNVVEAIVLERKTNGPYCSVTDFMERVASKDLNKKSLEALIKCGALDEFGERNQMLCGVEQLLALARETQKQKSSGQENLFSGNVQMAVSSIKLPQVEPTPKKERLAWEKELLGLYVSEHPLTEYVDQLKTARPCQKLTKSQAGQKVQIGGIISRIKKITTKAGQPMLFAEIEDLTGKIETLVFPRVLEQTADCWQPDKIVLVSGRVSDRDDDIKILCDGVRMLK